MGNRKEEILIVALHLFARDGYEAVSVSQIIGMILFEHFSSIFINKINRKPI